MDNGTPYGSARRAYADDIEVTVVWDEELASELRGLEDATPGTLSDHDAVLGIVLGELKDFADSDRGAPTVGHLRNTLRVIVGDGAGWQSRLDVVLAELGVTP